MRSITLKDKKQIVLNSDIELGEQEGNGKGRYFISRFIEPGIAHYEELGDILITKETLNKFIQTMVGVPVIIDHEDVTDKNVDKLRVGTVSKVWFNEFDGYFYCEGILTDKDAVDLVKNKGWNVSCAYSFVADETKKQHNGKDIDMEFTDGEFLHLAIVKNPRYEGANIVVNKSDDNLEWITVKGNHIPVKKGQSKDEAVKEFIEKQQGKSGDHLKGKYTKEDADFDEEQAKKDIEEAKKQGYKDIDSIADYLGLDSEEVIALTGEGYEDEDKSGDSGEEDKGYELSEKYKNHIQFKDDKESGGYPRKIHKDLESAKKLYESKKEGQAGAEKLNLQRSGKRGIPLRDDPVIVKNPIGEGYIVATVGLAQKHNLKEVYPIDRTKTNNSIGDITMTVLNDLTDFIKKVVSNEKDDEMKEVKNEDKRKLIDEVGGILKGKVDDEIIRTVIGKLEKIAYEPSEDSKADNEDDDKEEAKNKCKNEDDKEEDKKADNEDDEEDDEDVTKNEDDDEDKAENKKVKNSMKDIVMGGKGQVQEQKLYTSRKERLEEGNKY